MGAKVYGILGRRVRLGVLHRFRDREEVLWNYVREEISRDLVSDISSGLLECDIARMVGVMVMGIIREGVLGD